MDELDAGLILLTYTEAVSGEQKAAAAEDLAKFRASFMANFQVSLGWPEGEGADDSQALRWARWCAYAVRNWDALSPEFSPTCTA